MTIDEAILQEYNYMNLTNDSGYYEYHEQLAEWLEELKELREKVECARCVYNCGCIDEIAYKEGYNKAIDDFVAKYKNCDNRSIKCHKNLNCADCIAEQLKEGGENDN